MYASVDVLQPPGLDRLHDIVLPAAVSWWPPSTAALLLAGAGLAWVIAALLRRWRTYRRDAYRRAALREIETLGPKVRSAVTRERALQELGELLKRTALAAFPRRRVASLTGEPWLRFLARTCGDQGIETSGRILVVASYDIDAARRMSAEDCDEVLQVARRWIERHRSSFQNGEPKFSKHPIPGDDA